MGDPGVVPGLIGVALNEVFKRCIEAAAKIRFWKRRCDEVRKLLQQLSPLVEAISNHTSQAVPQSLHPGSLPSEIRRSITDLHTILADAETVLHECGNPDFRFNPVKRLRGSQRLKKTTERVKGFIETQMPLLNVAMIQYESEVTQKISIAVGQQTQEMLESWADLNKERVFAMIKDVVDRLNRPPATTRSEHTSNDDDTRRVQGEDHHQVVEEQPLPRYIFGMEEVSKRLHELLLSPVAPAENGGRRCKWIGIWAKGGAGKTLLVQTAMNSLLVRAHFEYRVYMVTVGNVTERNVGAAAIMRGTQRAVAEVQGKLAKKMDPSATWRAKTAEEGKTELLNVVRRKHPEGSKCLVVLDDVWDGDLLEWLDVLEEKEGSCMVLTTRDREVMRRVKAEEVKVGMLSEENSRKLFCVHAFGREDIEEAVEQAADVREVVKEIVRECGGLPLALKVVGGATASIPLEEASQWDLVLAKLRDAVELGESHETQLYSRLKLSYDSLPRLHRECFLYFAAFPEDFHIPSEDLVHLWIAEGLIMNVRHQNGDGGGGLHDPLAEAQAYSVLAILIARSLVELESKEWSFQHNAYLLTCKVHDVIRDLALYITHTTHRRRDAASWEKNCLFKAGWPIITSTTAGSVAAAGRHVDYHTTFPPRTSPFKDLLKETRRLSLVGSHIASLPRSKLPLQYIRPPLNVLLLHHNPLLTQIPHSFLASFHDLTVLELSHTGLTALPSSLGDLTNLTLLNLRRSASLQSLPPSLANLTNLRHLDLCSCISLNSLPPGKALTCLANLAYFNTRGCGGIWIPRRVSALATLPAAARALTCFGEQCCTTTTTTLQPMAELAALTKLRKLWIMDSFMQSIPAAGEALAKLTCLRYASLSFPRLPALPDQLQALHHLEVLDLNTCSTISELPEWIGDCMTSLKYLDLRGCYSIARLHPNLNKLTKLKKLELTGCSGIKELPPTLFSSQNSFSSLEELWLQGCARLAKFPQVAQGALPRLVTLNISYSDSLDALPDSFPHLGAKVTHLDMGSCRILNVDHITSHHLSAFLCLKDLVLKNNTRLTIVPLSVVSLPMLSKLDVSGCPNLKNLPDPSGSHPTITPYFPSLEELVAASSGLQDIPVSIVDIPSLKLLNVKDCDGLLDLAAGGADAPAEPAWRARARSRSGQLVVIG